MVGNFLDCRARAARGHAAEPPSATINSRRRITSPTTRTAPGALARLPSPLQCSDGIVQDGGGVTPGNDLVDDKAIKKRADDSDARVSEFVCSSGSLIVGAAPAPD